MFYDIRTIKKGGRFYLSYMASVSPVKFSRINNAQILNCYLPHMCDDLREVITQEAQVPSLRYSLRLSSQLLYGIVKIHKRKVNMLFDEISKFEENIIKHYHGLHQEKKPRKKRQSTNRQNRVQEDGDVTVRNVSEFTMFEEGRLRLNMQNDDFAGPPFMNSTTQMIDQDLASNIVNPMVSDDLEPLIRDVMVPEIHIESPKENLKRKEPSVMNKEKPCQDQDSESSESSEPIQPRKVNKRNRNNGMDSCNVFATSHMENRKPDTETCRSRNESFLKNLHHEINDDEKCQYENLNIVNGFHLHHFNVQGKMIPLYVKLMQTQETYNISDNVSRDEVIARLTDNDRRFRSLAPILHHTTLLGDDSEMQAGQSLCVPNAFRNQAIPGPSLPDTTQPIDEFTCFVGLPSEPSCFMEHLHNKTVENSEIPNSTMFEMNGSLDRTLVSVGDPQLNRTRNEILSEHWNPEALLVKIAEAQENGETNVNLEKIVAKDEESVSSVGPRRALVRAFASLLSLKKSGLVQVEKKPDSLEIQHISVKPEYSDEE